MSGMWVRGRAADRFDAAVGDVSGSGRDAVAPADLLAVVAALRDLPEVTPRPEHSVALRERLMVEADRLADLRAAASPVPSRDPAAVAAEERLRLRTSRRHPRRFAVLAGTVAALGASTTVAVAAQSALPGESLYGVKRALEDVRVGVSRDEAAHGELLLGQAADRLGEASALLGTDEPAALDEVSPTLDSFSDQAADGARRLLAEYARTGDRELVRDLRDFTTLSAGELDDMAVDLPASAREAWTRAGRTVDDIERDAFTACPLCAADPSGFEAGDDRLSAGDGLPTAGPVVPTQDAADDGSGDGDTGKSGRRGGGDRDARGRGLTPRGPGDGRDGSGRSEDGGDGGSTPPGTPRLPESDGLGDGLRDGLGDGVASGLGDGLGDGLGKGLGDGLRDGLGLDGSDGRKDGRKSRGGDRKKRGGGSGGLGDGLDDLLP